MNEAIETDVIVALTGKYRQVLADYFMVLGVSHFGRNALPDGVFRDE